MGFSFTTALSGLNAASETISVSGNNIANANTIGYKTSTISFSDVFSNSSGLRLNGAGTALQFGQGVRITGTPMNLGQGTLTTTDIATNSAIEGNGFFVVANSLGALNYTRAGDFTVDRVGNLVNPNGLKVQGYAAVNGAIPAGSALSSLTVPIGETLPPAVTSEAMFRMNLNSKDLVGTDFHAVTQVYDSKGVGRKLDLVFTKTGDGAYTVTATVDGTPATLSVNGGAPSAAPASLTFDGNGQLLTPTTSLSIIPDPTALNGAALPAINLRLREPLTGVLNLTNYAAVSALAATEQNGLPSGGLVGLAQSLDQNGVLYAVFSNGQRRLLGQIAVATFNSPTSLRRQGNNLYGETVTSGQATYGVPGTGSRGTIVGASLEQSNVDIATEFTNLIVAQRSFQANSRVINTISQTLQDLLQIT
jgi:flagellar hook protein FlgE